MRSFNSFAALADRLLPVLLMAVSVTLLSGGLLSYAPPAFGQWQTFEPSLGGGDPLFSAPAQSTSSPTATPAGPSPTPAATPSGSANPSATPAHSGRPPAPPSGAVASRIRIPSLGIDLPIVAGNLAVPGNADQYPLCDVAMYLPEFVAPGVAGTTYVYAHAQRGMFLPLLRASLKNDGAELIGGLVEVYSADGQLHLYEIQRVKRHATDLSLAQVAPGEHQLILQTSEGPAGTVPKLQVAARPVAVVRASASEANPSPQPRVCRPT